MRRCFAAVAAFASFAMVTASGQEPKRSPPVPPGRGLLPKPAEMPATLEGAPSAHPFTPDPSGGLSRTVFDAEDDTNFKIVIREFTFPPDRQPHSIKTSSAFLLQFLGQPGEVKVARQPLALRAGDRTAVAANAPVEITNNGERSVVVRMLIVEAK